MIDFSKLRALTIPEGNVVKIEAGGQVLWTRDYADYAYNYVSLGESIAAGHSITDDWADDYGVDSQYGENGNTETTIVINSYTDLIRSRLSSVYGAGKVSVKSFAHSGDTVVDLIEMLSHTEVKNAIKNADLVTLCIGANDILTPALSKIEQYINEGSPTLDELAVTVNANLAILNDDTNANSYRALFNKLYEINSSAEYVFSNIYNPLKYLWLDESTEAEDYRDGFFGPLLGELEGLGIVTDGIRGVLYKTSVIQNTLDRVNGPSRDGSDGLAAWTETHINNLNNILKQKIEEFGKSNFIFADSKQIYDAVPDRPYTADKHYNDLVNVEFTRGYEIADMDWGQFWDNFSASDIIGAPEEVMANIVSNIVTNVIVPDIDPHPETYGHYALYLSFGDVLGWQTLTYRSIAFNANGGAGTMETIIIPTIDGLTAYYSIPPNTFTPPSSGYNFTAWNTQADGSGTKVANEQRLTVNSNTVLYAQWINENVQITLTGTGKNSYAKATINGTTYKTGQAETIEVSIGTVITLAVKTSDEDVKYDAQIKLYKSGVYHSTLYEGEDGTCEYTIVGDTTLEFGYEEDRIELSGYSSSEYAGWLKVYE